MFSNVTLSSSPYQRNDNFIFFSSIPASDLTAPHYPYYIALPKIAVQLSALAYMNVSISLPDYHSYCNLTISYLYTSVNLYSTFLYFAHLTIQFLAILHNIFHLFPFIVFLATCIQALHFGIISMIFHIILLSFFRFSLKSLPLLSKEYVCFMVFHCQTASV